MAICFGKKVILELVFQKGPHIWLPTSGYLNSRPPRRHRKKEDNLPSNSDYVRLVKLG